MKLSARLQMNADLVPLGSRIADIGCDHGFVSIYLAEERICDRILALDIREGPLSAARRNIAAAGLSDRIECRLSDGLEKLRPGEADTLLMSGMGGRLVCSILNRRKEILAETETLVLQPQSDVEEVRRQLTAMGFQIEEERCCRDGGKWYAAIRAVRSDEVRNCTGADYRYGWILPQRQDPVYYSYLLEEREKAERVAGELERQTTTGAAAGLIRQRHTLALLSETLSLYQRADENR